MLHEVQLGEMSSIIVSTLTLPRYKISDLIQTIAGSDGRLAGWRPGLGLDSPSAPLCCTIHATGCGFALLPREVTTL